MEGQKLQFYLFLRPSAPRMPGHNPLAQTAIWLFNTVLGLFMIARSYDRGTDLF